MALDEDMRERLLVAARTDAAARRKKWLPKWKRVVVRQAEPPFDWAAIDRQFAAPSARRESSARRRTVQG